MSEGIIVIKKGREKPIIQQHPWIFSGAIDSVRGDPTPGDIVTVTDHKGAFLARGHWNPKSQIQVRILTWHDEPITDDWWRRMLKRAIDARLDEDDEHHNWDHTPCRLINAENDFIPGLIVDFYIQENQWGWLVLQALTLGIDSRKSEIARWLVEILKDYRGVGDVLGVHRIRGVFERSDVDVRRKEGLDEVTGVLYGDEPPERIVMQDSDYIIIDIRKGHKTGYYLDQSANRRILSRLVLDEDRNVTGTYRALNLFSYTGGFGLSFMHDTESQHVTNVDSSYEALQIAEENAARNYDLNAFEFIQADVFDYLHDQVAEGAQYDVIVCDPPKFAHNAGQVERAARGYKDLNLNCFKLVKPGGYLMTFSCSGAIDADLFQKIVFGALADSGRQAQIVKHLTQAEDHPVALTFPEGAYLKGLLLRVY